MSSLPYAFGPQDRAKRVRISKEVFWDPELKHLFFALIQNHSRARLISEEILHLLKGGD
jgi:hypothetical protein